jgi:hypothetical protein
MSNIPQNIYNMLENGDTVFFSGLECIYSYTIGDLDFKQYIFNQPNSVEISYFTNKNIYLSGYESIINILTINNNIIYLSRSSDNNTQYYTLKLFDKKLDKINIFNESGYSLIKMKNQYCIYYNNNLYKILGINLNNDKLNFEIKGASANIDYPGVWSINKNLFPKTIINDVLETDTKIWFATEKGIGIYDKLNSQYKHLCYYNYKINYPRDSDILIHDDYIFVQFAYRYPDWVMSWSRYNKKLARWEYVSSDSPLRMRPNTACLNNNQLLFSGINGLTQLDLKNNILTNYYSDTPILKIGVYHDDIWVLTKDSLKELKKNSNTWVSYVFKKNFIQDSSSSPQFGKPYILSFSNYIWIENHLGIIKFTKNNHGFSYYTNLVEPSSIRKSLNINNNFWIVTHQAIYKHEDDKNIFNKYKFPNRLNKLSDVGYYNGFILGYDLEHIWMFDIKKHSFYRIPFIHQSDFDPSNLAIDHDALWIGKLEGILKLDLKTISQNTNLWE